MIVTSSRHALVECPITAISPLDFADWRKISATAERESGVTVIGRRFILPPPGVTRHLLLRAELYYGRDARFTLLLFCCQIIIAVST